MPSAQKRSSDHLKVVSEDFSSEGGRKSGGQNLLDEESMSGPPKQPPLNDPDTALRKFRAKRHNEHMKAIYGVTNTLDAAIIGTAYILPEIQGVKVVQELDRPTWIAIGLCVIAAGHAIIRWGWRKED